MNDQIGERRLAWAKHESLFLWEFLTLQLPFFLTQDGIAKFLVNVLSSKKFLEANQFK